MALDVAREGAPRRATAVIVLGGEDPLEVIERELGIDRHHAGAQGHHGVDDLAALEMVLQGEVAGRQDLGQEVAQEEFAQGAAQLGRLQDLLQLGDIGADFEHTLGGFLELSELLAHIANDLGGGVEPIADLFAARGE